MISVDEARALLGDDAPESDADVAALRDLVAMLVEGMLESFCSRPDRAEDAGVDTVAETGGSGRW